MHIEEKKILYGGIFVFPQMSVCLGVRVMGFKATSNDISVIYYLLLYFDDDLYNNICQSYIVCFDNDLLNIISI
jgi:hypothetical protein